MNTSTLFEIYGNSKEKCMKACNDYKSECEMSKDKNTCHSIFANCSNTCLLIDLQHIGGSQRDDEKNDALSHTHNRHKHETPIEANIKDRDRVIQLYHRESVFPYLFIYSVVIVLAVLTFSVSSKKKSNMPLNFRV